MSVAEETFQQTIPEWEIQYKLAFFIEAFLPTYKA